MAPKFDDQRQWLWDRLQAFAPLASDRHEIADKMLTQDLLLNKPRCLWRDECAPGHVTASAWVVNPARTRVFMLKHKYLGIWVQFGGHADGNGDIHAMALQELHEETGFPASAFKTLLDGAVFDLDVHPIPANPKKNEPAHLHFDVRVLFELDDTLPLPPNPEGLEVSWLTLDEAAARTPPDNSVLRMIAKTRTL